MVHLVVRSVRFGQRSSIVLVRLRHTVISSASQDPNTTSMSDEPDSLEPTYIGYIATTMDALILFDACISGLFKYTHRRLTIPERQDLIKSGSVFVYSKKLTGIARWTDGKFWSPSRMLANFLIYRELDGPCRPRKRTRVPGKGRRICGIKKADAPSCHHMPSDSKMTIAEDGTDVGDAADSTDHSRPFKKGGLFKKTISIRYQDVSYTLVNYYKVDDVNSGRLSSPYMDIGSTSVVLRSDLVAAQRFRRPIEAMEDNVEKHAVPDKLLGMTIEGMSPPSSSHGTTIPDDALNHFATEGTAQVLTFFQRILPPTMQASTGFSDHTSSLSSPVPSRLPSEDYVAFHQITKPSQHLQYGVGKASGHGEPNPLRVGTGI